MTAFLAAHPALALVAVIAAAIAVVALAVATVLYATRDLGTRSSRPARRGPACRASEQRARAGKARAIFPRARAAALATTGWALHTAGRWWRAARTWWAFHRPRRKLSTEDRITLGVIHDMHLHDTGGLAALHHQPPEDMGPGAGFVPCPVAATSPAPADSPAAAPPAAAGHPHVPGQDDDRARDWDAPLPEAGREHGIAPSAVGPGPESEPSGAPVPAPAALTMAAVDKRAAEIAAVRAAPIGTYLSELGRATAYAHSDETDSFAAIAAGWS